MPQLKYPLGNRLQFFACRQIHPLEANSPGIQVRNEIGNLDAGCQIAVSK